MDSVLPPSEPRKSFFSMPFRSKSSSLPDLHPDAEAQASFFSRILFHWITPLIIRGSKKPLDHSDIPPLIQQDKSLKNASIFSQAYRLVTIADVQRSSRYINLPSEALDKTSLDNLSTLTNDAPRLTRMAQLFPPFLLRSRSLRALIPVSFAPFLRSAAIKPIWLLANITQAFCIRSLVDKVTNTNPDIITSSKWKFFPVVLALSIAAVVMSIVAHAVFAGSMRGGLRARAALSSAIFKKTMRLAPSSLALITEGEMGNLLVNDTQRVMDCYTYANFCWIGFFEILVISSLLTIDLGIAALFGVTVLIVLVPAQIYFSQRVCRARVNVSKAADKRVQIMTEVLSGIRMIKQAALESHFTSIINAHRAEEIRHLRVGGLLRDLNAALFFVAPVVVSFATFTAHTLIFKKPLSPANVFSTLSLFNTLSYILKLMPLGWLAISEAIVSGRRLDNFFDLQELDSATMNERIDVLKLLGEKNTEDKVFTESNDAIHTREENLDSSSIATPKSSARLVLRNAQFSFSKIDESGQQAMTSVLNNMNISVDDSELVCVVGPVASGKSSLLMGILGELLCTQGTVQRCGRVAYCAQKPWIVNGSLRENITVFSKPGEKFDASWYNAVIRACCLRKDIERLPAGDKTEIGERGVNLSGGQKARLALARAIYSKADIVILDDPLSAVDAAVTSHLIEQLFSKNGLLANKAVIIVTHQLKVLPLATKVAVLDHGTLKHFDNFQKLIEDGVDFSGLAEQKSTLDETTGSDRLKKSDYSNLSISNRAGQMVEDKMIQDSCNGKYMSDTVYDESWDVDESDYSDDPDAFCSASNTSKWSGDLVAKEDRCTGRVTSSVYRAYINAGGGYLVFVLVIIAFIFPQAFIQVIAWWISRWSTKSNVSTEFIQVNRFYAQVLIGLTSCVVLLTTTRALLFARQSMAASRSLHDELVDRALRAQPSFFDTNPLGRILNRFSKDMDNMDVLLPFASQDFMQIFFAAIAAIVTISWILPWFLIPIVPMIYAFLVLQRYYKRTSRELKRIDGTSRSPMYAHFTESIDGLATLRAFKCEEQFNQRFDEYVDNNNSSYHMFTCAGRWLGIRLDALAALIVFSTSLVVLLLSPNIDPGLAGVALTQSIMITGVFQWGVRQAAETENLFTSVERVTTMINTTPLERPLKIPDASPCQSWPATTSISFDEVELRYRPELDPALQKLSFTTKPAERIGIVGRTGSGKSSILVALLRMTELSQGRIIIDDVDISKIGLHDLRSRIAVVPQDPILFKGTIRSNLDPMGIHSDAQLWDVMRRVNMMDAVSLSQAEASKFACGLDTEVIEKGSNFSAGERQLLSLGRAILKGVNIVALDEASSSLDNSTDRLIQKTVREQFSNRTVLTIAHRLSTIADSDRVMVMEAGELVEFDAPIHLMGKGGYFAKLVEETGDVESQTLRSLIEESAAKRFSQSTPE